MTLSVGGFAEGIAGGQCLDYRARSFSLRERRSFSRPGRTEPLAALSLRASEGHATVTGSLVYIDVGLHRDGQPTTTTAEWNEDSTREGDQLRCSTWNIPRSQRCAAAQKLSSGRMARLPPRTAHLAQDGDVVCASAAPEPGCAQVTTESSRRLPVPHDPGY